MLKKLAVPLMVVGLAAFGCSSSSTGPTGTAGSGGHAGGGAGGHAGGGAGGTSTAGTGGGTAGTGGGTAGTGGGTAGTGGGTGGSAAGHDGGPSDGATDLNPDVAMADCTVQMSTGVDVLSAQVFCENQMTYCAGHVTLPYANIGQCITQYMALDVSTQHCRSYHLCWGVEGQGPPGGGNPAVHCNHTIGVNLCQMDGSTGN